MVPVRKNKRLRFSRGVSQRFSPRVASAVNGRLTDAQEGVRWRFERAHCGWQHSRERGAGYESAAPPGCSPQWALAARSIEAGVRDVRRKGPSRNQFAVRHV